MFRNAKFSHLLLWLGAILVIVMFAYAIKILIAPSKNRAQSASDLSNTLVDPGQATPLRAAPKLPTQTRSSAESVKNAQPFQFLVSYVGGKFEPTSLTIKHGNTVRFVNNSTGALWVSARSINGSNVYPGSSECGTSALDSCRILQPGEYWQFTFSEPGTWGFKNNANTAEVGTIHVI